MLKPAYRARDGRTTASLSEAHRALLEVESAIGPAEIAESGARTITRGHDLPGVFSGRQRRRAPGILFPITRPNGETSWSFRPNEARDARGLHQNDLARDSGISQPTISILEGDDQREYPVRRTVAEDGAEATAEQAHSTRREFEDGVAEADARQHVEESEETA
jgi:hypothetical protein